MFNALCSGSGNASHTYGNVIEAIRIYILKLFPDDYFKFINTSSAMAYKYFHSSFTNNNTMEFNKRVKPAIIFKPNFEIHNDDMFLSGTRLVTNIDNIEYAIPRSGLGSIIKDKEYIYGLYYKMNRDRISFEVTIQLETLHQQLDLYKYLINHITWDRPYYYKTALESMIPRSLIQYMSKLSNMNIADSSNIPKFLRHLQEISEYPITYKMKNSTSRDEFFMYYTPNILLTFSNLDKDEGNRKILISDDFMITFNVVMEFNIPGQYIVTGDMSIKYDHFDTTLAVSDSLGNTDYIPIFSLSNIYSPENVDIDGFHLYNNIIIKTDKDKEGENDTIDLIDVFDSDVRNVISQHIASGISPSIFIKARMAKYDTELEVGKDFDIDYNTMHITIYKSDSEATYRLMTYINNVYLTEKIVQNIDSQKQEIPLDRHI